VGVLLGEDSRAPPRGDSDLFHAKTQSRKEDRERSFAPEAQSISNGAVRRRRRAEPLGGFASLRETLAASTLRRAFSLRRGE
jgi:hypothetical protein